MVKVYPFFGLDIAIKIKTISNFCLESFLFLYMIVYTDIQFSCLGLFKTCLEFRGKCFRFKCFFWEIFQYYQEKTNEDKNIYAKLSAVEEDDASYR